MSNKERMNVVEAVEDALMCSIKEKRPMSKAAILAVADWIQANATPGQEGPDWWVASKLRREVGNG